MNDQNDSCSPAGAPALACVAPSGEELSPAQFFHVAAAIAIRDRVKQVIRCVRRLDPERSSGSVKPEQVHQLRVAIRRAGACLGAFEGCLDPGSAARLAKRLKKIRRAVGRARQCDVNMSLLAHEREAGDGAAARALDDLSSALKHERRVAVRCLDRMLGVQTPARLRKSRDATLEGIRPVRDDRGAPVTLLEAARTALRHLADEVCDPVHADWPDENSMHELRLAGKRLRYSTEVFACCFDPSAVDEALHQLVSLQDRLGAANDLYEISEFISRFHARDRSAAPLVARGVTSVPSAGRARGSGSTGADIASILERFRARHADARNDFMQWWGGGARERLFQAFDRLTRPTTNALADLAVPPTIHVQARPSRFPTPEQLLGGPLDLSHHAVPSAAAPISVVPNGSH